MSLGGLRLDEVSYLGKVRFLIPHHWVEDVEEDDTSCFHEDGADSGFLRISLIRKPVPGTATLDFVRSMMQEKFSGDQFLTQVGENIVAYYEREAESDNNCYIYWWLVASCVSRNLIREAVFSFTVLRDKKNLHETQDIVRLIGDLVSRASFDASE